MDRRVNPRPVGHQNGSPTLNTNKQNKISFVYSIKKDTHVYEIRYLRVP